MTILASVLLGLIIGYVALSNRLCVVAGVTDMRAGDYSFALVCSLCGVVLFALLPILWGTGLATPQETQTFVPLGALAGGALFGFSSVFARGSVISLLYRAGAGRLHALLAFMVMAFVAVFASDLLVRYGYPYLALELSAPGSSSWPGAALWGQCVLGFAGIACLLYFARRLDVDGQEETRNWRMAGAVVGVVIAFSWLLSGEFGQSRGTEDFAAFEKIVSVLAGGRLRGSEWMAGLMVGVAIGGGVAAARKGKFRIRWPRFADPFETVFGGAGMGIGVALAFGGSLTHLYSGIGGLMLNSLAFVCGMFPAVHFALRFRGSEKPKPRRTREKQHPNPHHAKRAKKKRSKRK